MNLMEPIARTPRADAVEPNPSLPPSGQSDSVRFSRSAIVIGWLVTFVVALAVYAATANRGVQWQDSGDRMLRILVKDPVGTMGLALSHPLHHWLGRIVVAGHFGEPAVVATLLSSLMGAIAVANVFGCVRTLTRHTGAAVFAAASLGVAHTFWKMSTLTETYTVTCALLAAECWCLAGLGRGRRWALPGMFLFNGLGIANHLLASLTTPVLVVVAVVSLCRRTVGVRHCIAAAVLWLAGSSLYTGLVVAELLRTHDLAGTLRSALFGFAFEENVLNTRISLGMLAVNLAFVVYNFPNLLLPAAAYGMVRGRRADVPALAHRALLAGLIIHAVFVLRYNIGDQYTFFLPLYLLLSVFGGMGAAAVSSQRASWCRVLRCAAAVLLLLTPAIYALTPMVARHFALLKSFPQRPYRDSYIYLFTPWGVADPSAERMATAALALAGPNGLILHEDRMGAFALEYKRIRAGHDALEIKPFPRVNTAQGLARFESLVRAAVAADRKVVLVRTDARDAAPVGTPAGMHWTRRGELFMLTADTP